MGLFDYFTKKREEKQAIHELYKAANEYRREARKNGVVTDDIPKGYGPFGLCQTNPIPTNGSSGSNDYLSRLRTNDGRAIGHSRIGSTSAPEVTSGMIDMYSISSQGVKLGTLYLCPYHRRTSGQAPEGFFLA